MIGGSMPRPIDISVVHQGDGYLTYDLSDLVIFPQFVYPKESVHVNSAVGYI